MFRTARLIPALCVSSGLVAQAMSDLNALVIQSSRYIARQTEGQRVYVLALDQPQATRWPGGNPRGCSWAFPPRSRKPG
jgi:hypothetical protein